MNKNNKGFTLVELLSSLVIIGLITVIAVNTINSTMSINEEAAYDILKSNIISVTRTYIDECERGLIDCQNDYKWNNDKTSFSASKLIKYNYFDNGELVNPINNKDISLCLIINIEKDKNKVLKISIDDNKC